MPGAPLGSVLITPEARARELYVALVPNGTTPAAFPEPVTITVGATALAAGTAPAALTVTSVTLPISIQAGQVLGFKNATGGTFLFEVTEAAAAGATTELTGIAREGIPAAAEAFYPARFELATSLDTSETTGTSTFETFDHTAGAEVSRGELTNSISTGAGAAYYNAGLETLKVAQRGGRDIAWVIEQPNPDSDAFDEPPYEWGVGIISDLSSAGGVADKLTRTVGIAIQGGINEVKPVLAS